jgi:hypothetical protein
MLYTPRIIITIFQVLEITSRLNEIHKRQLFFVIKTFKNFISVSEKHNCTSLYSQDVIGRTVISWNFFHAILTPGILLKESSFFTAKNCVEMCYTWQKTKNLQQQKLNFCRTNNIQGSSHSLARPLDCQDCSCDIIPFTIFSQHHLTTSLCHKTGLQHPLEDMSSIHPILINWQSHCFFKAILCT